MTAITPAYKMPRATRIGMQGGMSFITGTLTLVTYETSGGVDADVSGKFRALHHVSLSSPSGYLVNYVLSTNKMTVFEAGVDGAPLDEVGDGSLSLVADFLAVGTSYGI